MLLGVLNIASLPVRTSGPVARYVPRRLVVPLANLSVPVPVTLEAVVSVETPPANSSVAAPPIVNAPLLVPPAARLSVPLCTSTVPVLLNVTPENAVVVPAPVLIKVPAFRNVADPPKKFATSASLSASNRPVLLNTAPCARLRKPVSEKCAVPALVSVRLRKSLKPDVVSSSSLLTMSAPVPAICPPVHCRAAAVTLSDPVKVPPVIVTIENTCGMPVERSTSCPGPRVSEGATDDPRSRRLVSPSRTRSALDASPPRPTKATKDGSTRTLAAIAPLRSKMLNAVDSSRMQVPVLQSGAFCKASVFLPAANVARGPEVDWKTEPPDTTRNAPSRMLVVLPFASERSDPPAILRTLPPATL